MRKVSATVIYKDNTLYNLTVNHKGVLIPLIVYDETSVNTHTKNAPSKQCINQY